MMDPLGLAAEASGLADLVVLEAIVADAGAEALRLFERAEALDVSLKGPSQYVSVADLRIEAMLRERLTAAFGETGFIGEEGGGDFTGDGWVVDPIDGTSNFIRGLPLWGISVGLMRQGQPIMGVIAMPAHALTVSAASGAGLRLDGRPIGRRSPHGLPPTFAVGENPTWDRADIERTATDLRVAGYDVVHYRCASGALALSALGRLDGFVEHHLKLWDIAAGWIICEEAGMNVCVSTRGDTTRSIDVRAISSNAYLLSE